MVIEKNDKKYDVRECKTTWSVSWEKGRKETNIENARNLKKLGVAIDIISQATGLSKKDIETI